MLEDGIYGLQFRAKCEGKAGAGNGLAVLRGGKVLGSDPWGGVFTGSCEFDAAECLNKVRLQFDVPPEGELITGFCASLTGAVLDIVGEVEGASPQTATVIEVAGTPVRVELTYLGPLP